MRTYCPRSTQTFFPSECIKTKTTLGFIKDNLKKTTLGREPVSIIFCNYHRVKSSLLSLELSFQSLLQGRQTSKSRFYTVWQFKTKGVNF